MTQEERGNGMNRMRKIKHRIKHLLFGATYTNWLPGETPPPPMTEETMLKAYRAMVDAGVIEYGEQVYIETPKRKGKTREQNKD